MVAERALAGVAARAERPALLQVVVRLSPAVDPVTEEAAGSAWQVHLQRAHPVRCASY